MSAARCAPSKATKITANRMLMTMMPVWLRPLVAPEAPLLLLACPLAESPEGALSTPPAGCKHQPLSDIWAVKNTGTAS